MRARSVEGDRRRDAPLAPAGCADRRFHGDDGLGGMHRCGTDHDGRGDDGGRCADPDANPGADPGGNHRTDRRPRRSDHLGDPTGARPRQRRGLHRSPARRCRARGVDRRVRRCRGGVWTSPDGRTWETASVPQSAGTLTALASGHGRLVAVGTVFAGTNGPAAWTSVDGGTWAAPPGLGVRRLRRLRARRAGGHRRRSRGFVAVGSEVGAGGSRATAWYSPDGLVWTRTQSDLGGDSAGAVVQFGSGYVAAGWAPGANGDDRALFWTSPGWPDVGGRAGCEGPPRCRVDADAGRSGAASRRLRWEVARVGGKRTPRLDLAGRRHLAASGLEWRRGAAVQRSAAGVGAARRHRSGRWWADRHRRWLRCRRHGVCPLDAPGTGPGSFTAPGWCGRHRRAPPGPSSPTFPMGSATQDPIPRSSARSSLIKVGCSCSGSAGRRACPAVGDRPTGILDQGQ